MDGYEAMNVHYKIIVHHMFSVNMTFLHFSMDYSGINCTNTALHIYMKLSQYSTKYLRFCGKRDAWTELSYSNSITLVALSLKLLIPFRISMIYNIFDKGEYQIR